MKHARPSYCKESLIIQPDDGIRPLLQLVNDAQTSLNITQFKFDALEIIQAVIAAHRRGVQVRVMLNPVNGVGARANQESFATFEQHNVPVRWSNPAFPVTHQKSMIIDNVRGMIATYNFSPKYYTQTRDLGIVTDDPTLVQEMLAGFESDWECQSFVPHSSELLWSNVNARHRMGEFVDTAKHTLDICHPKFVDLAILNRISAAHDRGVRVRILCGGKHGLEGIDLIDTLSALQLLSRAKIKVHRMQHLKLHAKLILVDHHHALVGSMNITRNAFDLRRELGIIVGAKHVIERISQVFEEDFHRAHEYHVPDSLNFEAHPQDELPHDPDFSHE